VFGSSVGFSSTLEVGAFLARFFTEAAGSKVGLNKRETEES
jgi:hypothetical protein